MVKHILRLDQFKAPKISKNNRYNSNSQLKQLQTNVVSKRCFVGCKFRVLYYAMFLEFAIAQDLPAS